MCTALCADPSNMYIINEPFGSFHADSTFNDLASHGNLGELLGCLMNPTGLLS